MNVFAALASPDSDLGAKAVDAVDRWTRDQLFPKHYFTKRPKRSIINRIMPPIPMKTKEEWLALGVRECDLEEQETTEYPSGERSKYHHPWWERGWLFYEIVEDRLRREDFEIRLMCRQVGRREWERHRKEERRLQIQFKAMDRLGRILFLMHHKRADFVTRYGEAETAEHEKSIIAALKGLAENAGQRMRWENLGPPSAEEKFAYAVFNRLATQIQKAGERNGEA